MWSCFVVEWTQLQNKVKFFNSQYCPVQRPCSGLFYFIMETNFKIPFAFNESGEIIDINNAQKGVDYKCNCGGDLRVRGGEKIRNHFYHSGDEVPCSLESFVHKAYKQEFLKLKSLSLPFQVNGIDILNFDKIELEKKLHDFIPDAIGYIDGQMYLVEFACTSFIKQSKLKKIQRANVFCIEIIINKNVCSLEEIRSHLISENKYKDIVHIPEYYEMAELRSKYAKEYNLLKTKYKESLNKVKELECKIEDILTSYEPLEKIVLYRRDDCKNGSLMFSDKTLYGKANVVGFVNENNLTVKFNSKDYYKFM